MFPFKKILSPVDFSEPSNEAINVAVEMAVKFQAELLFVYVVPEIPVLPDARYVFKEHDYEVKLHEDAKERLANLVQQSSKRGVKATSEVGTANDAAVEIIRIGEHNGVDLIVLATHGMTGWHRLVFGSVAEKIVRVAQCPVLILRTAKPAESK
jgi:nucleotide-binding universal stress UspA family protein